MAWAGWGGNFCCLHKLHLISPLRLCKIHTIPTLLSLAVDWWSIFYSPPPLHTLAATTDSPSVPPWKPCDFSFIILLPSPSPSPSAGITNDWLHFKILFDLYAVVQNLTQIFLICFHYHWYLELFWPTMFNCLIGVANCFAIRNST